MVILLIIKTIVHFYDIITLPIYIVFQKPWIKLSKSRAIKAKQLDAGDPYSPWVSLETAPKHFIDDCRTLNEATKKCIEIHGRDKKCLGYRQLIGKEVDYIEGKPITKHVLSDYKWITYGEFDEKVDNIGKGLLLRGVESGDKVMIFADTSIDWFICAQSILRIGATITTLYTSANDEGIVHVMNETEVTHVLTSHHLIPKLINLKNKIPKLSTIIYFKENHDLNKNSSEKIEENLNLDFMWLSDLEEMAIIEKHQKLTYQSPVEDDIALLIYTSGSSGDPKGVKITHKNLMTALYAFKLTIQQIKDENPNTTYIAYLPLAHLFEFIVEHILFLYGLKIGYSSANTLTDTGTAIRTGDKGDATLLKPTLMAGVPLVFDRICKGINDKISTKGKFAQKLLKFLVDYKSFWSQKGFDTPLMNRIFCNKFRGLLGGEISVIICGGAPLSKGTQKTVKSCLNVRVLQGYGTSETSSNGLLMSLIDESLGRVGSPVFGSQIKLIDWEEGGYRVTDKPNPRGEIVFGSESVSDGYYKLDDMTAESFYVDGKGNRWFLTGDIGEAFTDGTFKIIDRKKDLIKLQFGEYVSLGKIETELKTNDFVDNICVFGHLYHSNLIALVIPNQPSLTRLAKVLGVDFHSITDLCKNKRIVDFITLRIRRHALRAGLNKHEIPQKVILCSEEWTPDNGLLTAAMKIKRKTITNKFQKEIESIYENQDNNNFKNNQ